MHIVFNDMYQLLDVVKISAEKWVAEAHCSMPLVTLPAYVAETCRDNRNPCLPILLRVFYQFDETRFERHKRIEVGLGRRVRIDVGIALWKNDHNLSRTEQPHHSPGQLPDILTGFDGRIGPSLIYLVSAKLFAAQDNLPVGQRAGKLYRQAQFPRRHPVQCNDRMQTPGDGTHHDIPIVEIMEVARRNQYRPGLWDMLQSLDVYVHLTPAEYAAASTH